MPTPAHRIRRRATLLVLGLCAVSCSGGDDDDEGAGGTTIAAVGVDSSLTSVASTAEGTVTAATAPTTEPPPTEPASTAPATTEPATTEPATTEPATTAVETSSPPVELVAPGALGPYGVGRTTVTMTDETRARPLTIDLWYPIAPGTVGAPTIYSFAPGIEFPSTVALADAPVGADRPYPLVVYSHGSGGLRYVASFFTEALASHGFVVAAPDHAGNTATEVLLGGATPFEVTAVNRPLDVTFVIDQLLAKAADPADALAGSIDAGRVGVAGHSFGGYTALVGVSGVAVDGTAVPADARIGAIVAMAPATERLSDAELSAVDVPTMLMVGTADRSTPVDPNVTRAWSLVQGKPRYRVELVDAGHQSFTDVCQYQRDLPTLPAVPQFLIDAVDVYALEACGPELMPITRAHELTNTYAISFLLAELADEPGYAAFIDPAAVTTPDVTVQRDD